MLPLALALGLQRLVPQRDVVLIPAVRGVRIRVGGRLRLSATSSRLSVRGLGLRVRVAELVVGIRVAVVVALVVIVAVVVAEIVLLLLLLGGTVLLALFRGLVLR